MTNAMRGRKGDGACTRAWEVEAARDGRISGDELDVVIRHVDTCVECASEFDYMEGLGRRLRELDPPNVDEIVVRRLRRQVLARVDAEIAGRSLPPPPRKTRSLALPVLGSAATVLALAVWLVTALSPHRTQPKTTVDAIAEGDARWMRRSEGDIERVELSDGTLRLRVNKAPGGKRVVVHVPDGEIEDLGTVFHVVVAGGRTQRVAVDEGRVTIRLANTLPITISSGQTWDRPEELPPPATPALSTASSPSAVPTASHPQRSLKPTSSTAVPAPPPHADEEDASYLQAIRLLRDGRGEEAKVAAREYLRRFPDGFRREEMGRIAK